jgi:hypothetical protein
MKMTYRLLTFILVLLVGLACAGCRTRIEEPSRLSGTLFFEDGKTLAFSEITGLIFSLEEGAESIPQNVSDWPVTYDDTSVSRSIPLSWVKSIEVLNIETRGLYRCLFNPKVLIESITGAKIVSEYKSLEWVRIKVADKGSAKIGRRFIYFADSGVYLQSISDSRIQIRKIVFDRQSLKSGIK